MAEQVGTGLFNFHKERDISTAALHFGEAICPPGNETCVRDVAQGWERRVEESFGVPLAAQDPPGGASQPYPQGAAEVRWVRSPSGGVFASLARGQGPAGEVRLCIDTDQHASRCKTLGSGPGAMDAATALLDMLGFKVG